MNRASKVESHLVLGIWAMTSIAELLFIERGEISFKKLFFEDDIFMPTQSTIGLEKKQEPIVLERSTRLNLDPGRGD